MTSILQKRQKQFIRRIADASSIIALFSCLDNVYFFMKDRKSRFMGANALQLQKLGLANETDILGKSDFDFFPRHMITGFHADDRQVMESRCPIPRKIELVAYPGGLVSWHITSKFPLLDARGRCIGLIGIMRDLDTPEGERPARSPLGQVMHYIGQHYAATLDMDDLARLAGLSISQFDRRFRKIYGLTPSRFVIHYRLAKAGQMLLRGNHTISTIAHAVGFYDHSHFSREFKKMFGASPGAYRQKHLV
ncbi:MAG: AraC family transcriptional regulator [Verrucomicrobia bacterium]|nr:AraC family transcriptional regulator [Verrucomicrobiota bacterium]